MAGVWVGHLLLLFFFYDERECISVSGMHKIISEPAFRRERLKAGAPDLPQKQKCARYRFVGSVLAGFWIGFRVGVRARNFLVEKFP